ncbi:hypothetical protein HGRIS_014801 [Hohenbuehelia grisea]|uniref:Uncharacterized protein n=1 Tax=Hohenbuehelia grisea TaxID=104357 RepID=A0ABR3IQR9_9AGAR
MPPKSVLWEAFSTDFQKSLYKEDKSHKAVWCGSCLEKAVKLIQAREVAAGHVVNRSKEEWDTTARAVVEPK